MINVYIWRLTINIKAYHDLLSGIEMLTPVVWGSSGNTQTDKRHNPNALQVALDKSVQQM